MGLIVRTVIIVGTMAIMSPVNQRDLPGPTAAASASVSESSRELARRAGEHAMRQMSPAVVATVWNAVEPADREALARAVLDALIDDKTKPPARPGRTPQG